MKSLAIEEKLGRPGGHGQRSTATSAWSPKIAAILERARELWTKARDLFAKIGMPHMVKEIQAGSITSIEEGLRNDTAVGWQWLGLC